MPRLGPVIKRPEWVSRHVNGIGETILELVSTVGPPELYVLVAVVAMAETLFMADLVVPGEVGMALAGLAAAETSAPLAIVILVAALGAWVGDSLSYLLGRKYARPLLARLPWLRRRIDTSLARATYYFKEHGGRVVLLGRFVGFLRAVVPVAAGMGGMPWRRFTTWNIIASLSWAAIVVSLGYFFGRPFARSLDSTTGLLITLVVGMILIAGWRHARHRADRRRARLTAHVSAPSAETGIPV